MYSFNILQLHSVDFFWMKNDQTKFLYVAWMCVSEHAEGFGGLRQRKQPWRLKSDS